MTNTNGRTAYKIAINILHKNLSLVFFHKTLLLLSAHFNDMACCNAIATARDGAV